ncbi:DUF89 domain-containing protein [Pisolithus croceorrhizus]|nr:DUF89 domain-containing protein [Pisolithus croceorrhizus]
MFEVPYPPYDPQDKSSFAYETVLRRWPVIITNLIDHVHRLIHDLTMESQALANSGSTDPAIQLKIEEGKGIIAKASHLKYRMARDQELEMIPDDGEFYVHEYNSELEKLSQFGKNTWFTAPWLYAECYLYRLFRSYFKQSTKWTDFDPFYAKKEETFRSSVTAIHQIATTMHELETEKDKLVDDPDKLSVLFKEMVQMCLWGNATDLSLLTHLTPSDIEHLQTVGREAQQARKEFILKDDQDAVWEYINSLEPRAGTVARCDFVLDNAGFELFTDLVFADFLVTHTPYFSEVVFHPKLFPWFVSDVTPTDFHKTIESLSLPTFFNATAETTPESAHHLKEMVERWRRYLEQGIFRLSTTVEDGHKKTQFWTGPWPYWYMEDKANSLWRLLTESGLVIFKGDLNYRKLAGDVKWPVTTPFATALGPLAGSFPLLSLRTNKADVVVGISQGVADELDEKDKGWRVNGKYALVSFLPKDRSE